MEFVNNRGRIFLEADSPAEALHLARDVFRHIREENVQALGGDQYLVTFRVSLNYRLSLIHVIDRAVRLIRSAEAYERARYIERYIIASACQQTGKPVWLNSETLGDEISQLRKAAVVAREVASVMRFLDWDICIANYLELNSKPGHQSRVVRKPRRTATPGELTVAQHRTSRPPHVASHLRPARATRRGRSS